MREIMTRALGDGSQTTIALFLADDGTLVVEAVNVNGTSSATAAADEALAMFNHPFSRPDWLDYPVSGRKLPQRALTPDEYALAEMLAT